MSKNAYQIEYLRAELAAKGEKTKLRKLYTTKKPEIKDLNTQKFWNKLLYTRASITAQDGMTRDRAAYTANVIPQSVKKLLDVGIGHGWVEELIESRDIAVSGVDISDDAIRQLKARFPKWRNNFKVQSIYNLDYKKGSFNAVLLLEVLEHIPPSKTFSVLKTIHQMISSNGYIIVSVPTNEGLEQMEDNPSGHVRMYTVPLLKAELELSGFAVQSVQTFYAFQTLYNVKKFLATKVFHNRWKPNNIIMLAQKK